MLALLYLATEGGDRIERHDEFKKRGCNDPRNLLLFLLGRQRDEGGSVENGHLVSSVWFLLSGFWCLVSIVWFQGHVKKEAYTPSIFLNLSGESPRAFYGIGLLSFVFDFPGCSSSSTSLLPVEALLVGMLCRRDGLLELGGLLHRDVDRKRLRRGVHVPNKKEMDAAISIPLHVAHEIPRLLLAPKVCVGHLDKALDEVVMVLLLDAVRPCAQKNDVQLSVRHEDAWTILLEILDALITGIKQLPCKVENPGLHVDLCGLIPA